MTGRTSRQVDNSVWSEHVDIHPTILALLRLHDDYAPDGRVLGETGSRLPWPNSGRSATQ